MMNDDNAIGDIQGLISCLCSDLERERDGKPIEYPILSSIDILGERLRLKFSKTKNNQDKQWFGNGIESYQEHKEIYSASRSRNYDKMLALLSHIEDMYVNGNKANRRGVNYIIDPTGVINKISAQQVDAPDPGSNAGPASR